ncbi:MAG: hypothetical protein E7254_07270 [Lachnospiraceae bacterium]|nr:hypothetical protein [Lachnospiraceae bacterium]
MFRIIVQLLDLIILLKQIDFILKKQGNYMQNFLTSTLKLIKITFITLCLLVGITAIYLLTHITNKNIVVANYEIKAEVPSAFRIVEISDYHNSELSKDNEKLIKLVKEQKPDIIVLAGDLINGFKEETENAEKLIRQLSEITTVYVGDGNHEYAWEGKYNKSINELYTNAGAKVLDNSYIDVDIRGNLVRIGGYMGYYRIPGMVSYNGEKLEEEEAFFDNFENTDRYKILINHIPTTWVDWNYSAYPVDLVLSGHYHGGQWVLPFIGAVYAPYIGINPPNTRGVYHGEYATTIISSGVGNEFNNIPRINNPPEIVVVDVKPE